jgi:hypothetical protein
LGPWEGGNVGTNSSHNVTVIAASTPDELGQAHKFIVVVGVDVLGCEIF